MTRETVTVTRRHLEKLDSRRRRLWQPGSYEVPAEIAERLRSAGVLEEPADARPRRPARGTRAAAEASRSELAPESGIPEAPPVTLPAVGVPGGETLPEVPED